MWFTVKCCLPYQTDPDYRDSFIFYIQSKIGHVPIDITLLEDYGIIEIDTDVESANEIAKLPFICGKVQKTIDRKILSGHRTVIV